MALDVRLTKIDNGMLDIKMENGRALFATDGTEAAQHGAVRLQKFIDESVIDDEDEDYTKWYEIIFNVAKSEAEKQLELKRRILQTTGVIRIISFTWEQVDPSANVTGKVLTEWGIEDISATVPL